MDSLELFKGLLYWLHLVTGVLWIGHLFFFNFVNAQLAKTYDADSKKKVVPELMPRALYFFRWGAAYTWVSGFILFVLVYWLSGGKGLLKDPSMSNGIGHGVSFSTLILGFVIYEAIWNSPLKKNETAAAGVSFAVICAAAFGLSTVLNGNALFLQLGATFGTIMAANVWMRIWPAQRKIIAGIAGTGPAADAAVPATATLRSKHNTYLSIPLMGFMVSAHLTQAWANAYNWAFAIAFVAVGFGAAKFLYTKSASAAPKFF